ncbi:SSI family serine proteinase inhibitor [Actinacidiphila sp. ITFR-21]|uniref:SSI family serine proteinase inhibitor n=1 Tax=Actinacidiphila sp. ITFR-21 TaxID=3075199 RepID=UPI00288B9555|nr:SSI family serine proteinase inhibitor [Streptomyces sp. ITFR-21]WNI17115.1 SSI family serine proteinase inhibitor [Streptomyces sp. ITFR-21]
MPSCRVTARLAVLAVLAVLTLGVPALPGLATTGPGPAAAAADRWPGPGLRLTVGGTRTALLYCEPAPHGPHPFAGPACVDLTVARGDFDALPGRPAVCHEDYAPVTATADGRFADRRVHWRKKFANPCVLRAATGPVFAL